jgi:hypothetical protein
MEIFENAKKKSIFGFLLICTFFTGIVSCTSMSAAFQNWEEIDNISLEYDMETYNLTNRLFTDEDGYELINEFLNEYLSNAYMVKISQETFLNKDNEHKLIISRRWTGESTVKYYIYRLQIVYRNCSINYEFINDNRNGAIWEGDDLGFIAYYRDEHVSKFRQDVNSVMRIIYNSLINSNDPMIMGQAQAIRYNIDNYQTTYFF